MKRQRVAHSRGHHDLAQERFERAHHLAVSCGYHRIAFASARMVLALVSEVPLDVELGEQWFRHASVSVKAGRIDEARRRVDEAREILEPLLPAHRLDLGRVYTVLGTIQHAAGDLPAAKATLEHALAELREIDARQYETDTHAKLEAVLAAMGATAPTVIR